MIYRSSDGKPLTPPMTTEEFLENIIERVLARPESEVDGEVESDEINEFENVDPSNQNDSEEEPVGLGKESTETDRRANNHTSCRISTRLSNLVLSQDTSQPKTSLIR